MWDFGCCFFFFFKSNLHSLLKPWQKLWESVGGDSHRGIHPVCLRKRVGLRCPADVPITFLAEQVLRFYHASWTRRADTLAGGTALFCSPSVTSAIVNVSPSRCHKVSAPSFTVFQSQGLPQFSPRCQHFGPFSRSLAAEIWCNPKETGVLVLPLEADTGVLTLCPSFLLPSMCSLCTPSHCQLKGQQERSSLQIRL